MNQPKKYAYRFESVLPGMSAQDVWNRVSAWEGVNYELGPLVEMTFPSTYSHLLEIPADGESHFTSKILLFGFLPIDAHKFALRAISPPNYFDESSSNNMMRVWTHKRVVAQTPEGVKVTDECTFEPRFRLTGGLLLFVYKSIFAHRHARLKKYFS